VGVLKNVALIPKGGNMKIFAWADQKVKANTVWDIGILKIFCVLVGMIIGAYLSEFVLRFEGWFLVVSLVLLIVLMVRLFTSKANK